MHTCNKEREYSQHRVKTPTLQVADTNHACIKTEDTAKMDKGANIAQNSQLIIHGSQTGLQDISFHTSILGWYIPDFGSSFNKNRVSPTTAIKLSEDR